MSLYTEQLGKDICEELSTGDLSLRQIAAKRNISHSLILKWATDNESFRDQYACSLNIGVDAAFESLRDRVLETPQRLEDGRIDPAWVNLKRLEVDTLKWELSKRLPKKYGDRTDLNIAGKDGGPIQFVTKSILEES